MNNSISCGNERAALLVKESLAPLLVHTAVLYKPSNVNLNKACVVLLGEDHGVTETAPPHAILSFIAGVRLLFEELHAEGSTAVLCPELDKVEWAKVSRVAESALEIKRRNKYSDTGESRNPALDALVSMSVDGWRTAVHKDMEMLGAMIAVIATGLGAKVSLCDRRDDVFDFNMRDYMFVLVSGMSSFDPRACAFSEKAVEMTRDVHAHEEDDALACAEHEIDGHDDPRARPEDKRRMGFLIHFLKLTQSSIVKPCEAWLDKISDENAHVFVAELDEARDTLRKLYQEFANTCYEVYYSYTEGFSAATDALLRLCLTGTAPLFDLVALNLIIKTLSTTATTSVVVHAGVSHTRKLEEHLRRRGYIDCA